MTQQKADMLITGGNGNLGRLVAQKFLDMQLRGQVLFRVLC
jgi:hypothetical protein